MSTAVMTSSSATISESSFVITNSSSRSSSGSSDSRKGFSSDIYSGIKKCCHCDTKLNVRHYVVDNYAIFCDARCYTDYLVLRETKAIENDNEAVKEANRLLRENKSLQEISEATTDSLVEYNNELLQENKDLKKEIQTRNDEIDKFTLLDFD